MSQGYLHIASNYQICISYSYACAIPDNDNEQLIITGGLYTLKTVSVYNEAGYQRDLTELNQGRRQHACASYVNGGKKVKNPQRLLCHIIYSLKSFSWSLGVQEQLDPVILTAQRSSVTMSGKLWLENYLFQCMT